MKKVILILPLLACLLTSCLGLDDLKSRMDDIQARLEAMEDDVDALNDEVEALGVLIANLEDGCFVTEITEVSGQGYWITFNDGSSLYVAVARDGKDGADGKDGEDGKDGADGKDGKDGEDGKDGADGVTPQLMIEGGYWYVSFDEGKSWTRLGKAVGNDGTDGVTPILKIENGYWYASYDNGVTWGEPLGSAGSDSGSASTQKPLITAKQDQDGLWYWASSGDFLLDEDGRKVPVSTMPKIKIEDGYWYVSYDNGQTWDPNPIAKWSPEEDNYIFEKVDTETDPDIVTITLNGGRVINLPVAKRVTVNLTVSGGVSVQQGRTVTLTYNVSGAEVEDVIVDDINVESSSVTEDTATSGRISIKTLSNVALVKQRVLIAFNFSGVENDDWWMLTFDGDGHAVINDLN